MKTTKTAIVTGCPGQDAYYLCQLLLEKDYRVIGTYRYSSTNFKTRFKDYPQNDNIKYVCCDITDPSGVNLLISQYKPDEVYNLAAASHVGESFKNPRSVFNINCGAVINFLEAIRHLSPGTKIYNAGSSEEFGSNYSTVPVDKISVEDLQDMKNNTLIPETDGNDFNVVKRFQDENTPFSPNSPYAAAKLAARNIMQIYKKSYGLFTCSGILFNHEGPGKRGENFVTRKITKWIAEFINWKFYNDNTESTQKFKDVIVGTNAKTGFTSEFPKLRLGNVDSVRDWSHAADMVRGMYLMLQQNKPDDFVLASGTGHSVRDFLKAAFLHVGIKDYDNYWVVDPEFFRPCEVPYLRGSTKKAGNVLGWTPEITFNDLVKEMVDHDLSILNIKEK